MNKLPFLFAVLLLLAGCQSKPETVATSDIQGIDSSIKPENNFFMYVNRIWYDTAQIPPSQSGVGAYMFMNFPQRLRLQGILDSVSKANNIAGSIEQKLGDFYASGMDTTTINQRSFDPIKPVLTRIDSISNLTSLMKFVATEARLNNTSFLAFGVGPDNKNSKLNIAHIYQTGIGLPERDYYFRTDAPSVAIQQAYKLYLSRLFQLTGSDSATAAKDAGIVYNIDKQLAGSHRTNIELRDVNANYNKMSVTTLEKKQPNIGWQHVLNDLGAKTDSIDVAQPSYYDKLNTALKSIPISEWKIYLKAYTISNYADELSQPFVDASFELNKVITGQAVQKTRGEKMASSVDRQLGWALGQLYVKKYFTEDAKKRVLDLVNNLQKALAARVDKLDWMSDSTKLKAKEKLFAITKKIGYPDKWRDYSNVVIVKNKYFENVVSASSNNYLFQLAKLNKPVDRSEWLTTPSTVTAYNNPNANEIVFPAAILQPPYFDNNADDALNYGGIGMVIGHEITHTFDDQGAQFDEHGKLENWWTPEDAAHFKAAAEKLVAEFDAYQPFPDLKVNGRQCLSENIADVAGLAVAHDGWRASLGGTAPPKIQGMSAEQAFFLSFGQSWRHKNREEVERRQILTDGHAPAKYRADTVRNLDAWYDAYGVKPGQKLYLPPVDRVKVW